MNRYVIKMATGSGKTKVLGLLLAWSFFHKTYEEDSTLARNFLLITPNIIVLDRIRADFDGLKIFLQRSCPPGERLCRAGLEKRLPAHAPHPGRCPHHPENR